MVRPLKRKPIEEVYGPKFETLHPPKSQVNNYGTTKTSLLRTERANDLRTQRDFVNNNTNGNGNGAGNASNLITSNNNGYLITSNCPVVTTTNSRGTAPAPPSNPYASSQTHRRSGATARKVNNAAKPPQYVREESKVNYNVMMSAKPPVKGVVGQQNMSMNNKPVTQRGCYTNTDMNSYISNFSDKDLVSSGMLGHTQGHTHQHQHSHHHHRHGIDDGGNGTMRGHNHSHNMHTKHHTSKNDDDEDEDKDDDPEEFFELIRQTVQNAIGNTVSDVLNRNLRDLGSRIERFSTELKQTNEHLNRLQEQVTTKIVHYGEENSRHFRYLCMKSEYDKIFYQHHTMIANKKTPTTTAEDCSPQFLSPHSSITPTPTQPNIGRTSRNSTNTTTTNGKSGTNASISPADGSSNTSNLKSLRTHTEGGRRSQQQQPQQQLQQQQQKLSSPDTVDCLQVPSPCTCRSTKSPSPHSEPHKSSSERSVGNKSSDLNMREVLEHIQRFCTEMQISNFNPDGGQQLPQQSHQQQQQQHPMKTKDLLANLNELMSTGMPCPAMSTGMEGSMGTMNRSAGGVGGVGIGKSNKLPATQSQSITANAMENLYNDVDDYDFILSSDAGITESSEDNDTERGLTTPRSKRILSGAGGDAQ